MTARDTALRHVNSHLATPEQQAVARDLLGDSWFPTLPKSTRLPTLHEMQAMGYRPPQQYRLTLWAQYRRWLWNGLRSGSFAAVAMGASVLTVYAHVWGIW